MISLWVLAGHLRHNRGDSAGDARFEAGIRGAQLLPSPSEEVPAYPDVRVCKQLRDRFLGRVHAGVPHRAGDQRADRRRTFNGDRRVRHCLCRRRHAGQPVELSAALRRRHGRLHDLLLVREHIPLQDRRLPPVDWLRARPGAAGQLHCARRGLQFEESLVQVPRRDRPIPGAHPELPSPPRLVPKRQRRDDGISVVRWERPDEFPRLSAPDVHCSAPMAAQNKVPDCDELVNRIRIPRRLDLCDAAFRLRNLWVGDGLEQEGVETNCEIPHADRTVLVPRPDEAANRSKAEDPFVER